MTAPTHVRITRPVAGIWLATSTLAVAYLLLPDRSLSRTVAPMLAIGAVVLAISHRVRRSPPGQRRPWILLAASLAGFATSDLLIVLWPTLTGSTHPWPGPAHVPFQLGLALMISAVIAFIRVQRRPDRAAALDTLIVGTSLVVVAWVLIIRPLLAGGLADGPLIGSILVTHPLLHIGLLLAGWRLSSTASRHAPACWALLAGLGLLIATSTGMGVLAMLDRYRPEGPLTLGWIVAAGCLAVAARHPTAARLTEGSSEDPPRSPARRMVAHAVAALALPGLMLLRTDGPGDALVAAGTAVVLILVTLRLRSLLIELEAVRASEVADQRERDRRRFEALVRYAADVLLVIGAEGRVEYASPSAATMFDTDPTGWSRSRLAEQLHPDERQATVSALLERLTTAGGRPVRLRARFLDRNEREQHAELVAIDLLDDPDVAGVVITLHDTTGRAELEAELRRLAFHDPLTGLPNRTLFQDRLVQALHRAGRTGRPIGVLICDLDDFKDVNDTLGHPAGDQLLRELAGRFSVALRATDTVARIGGDEFAILCEDLGSTRDAVRSAQRILEATEEPVDVEGRELRVGVSIGIAVDTGTRSADEMLRDADVALYEAKGQGKQGWALHRTAMTMRAQARLQLDADLAKAVEERHITLAFQPIHELASDAMVGVEALARWHHPDRGWIPPSEFIAVAEQNGLIVPLGNQVLERGLATLRRWADDTPGRILRIGINVSARHLLNPSLPEVIASGLERHRIPGDELIVELTESVMLEDPQGALRVLHRLRELGVRFAIDDFGTGYSSLAYLRQLPVDIVKIDRSFVHGLTTDTGAADLIRSIIDLATGMGLDTVAEGVETDAQREMLREMGCRFAQGFLYGRPTDAETLLNHPARTPATVEVAPWAASTR